MREKKRKIVGNATKRQTRGIRQGARGEDKNVDWPQIESRPFITLRPPASALLPLGSVRL